ncbi:MAG: phosphatidylinositol N-acetylglucosaminyltransferase subunit gpi1 [Chaenotheca gracillima]|nr:MAG: phosphatidylinositol N-acetylglucosaminyltransferase subunit gpi1 [Chaenotheca gracillima]
MASSMPVERRTRNSLHRTRLSDSSSSPSSTEEPSPMETEPPFQSSYLGEERRDAAQTTFLKTPEKSQVSRPPLSRSPLPRSPLSHSTSASCENSPSSSYQVQERRPSSLSDSLLKQEHTVVKVKRRDGKHRLITCVKSSQGFDWNTDMFLPHYVDDDESELKNREDPVDDIHVTDEDGERYFPT